jgi:hypothetical protein
MEIFNCKFTNEQIDNGCENIFGLKFLELSQKERDFLIEEYNRLDELPCISVLSCEEKWDEILFDEKEGIYVYKKNIDESSLNEIIRGIYRFH